MVRTVVAMLRTLPAHGARLRAMRRRGARDGGGGGGFSFEIKNVDRGGTIASAHPGKAEGYRTYAFTDVPTSIGKLSACVYFLDQVAMSALEDECVAGVETAPTPCERLDASVGPDVVALAGGEMSLSPSPTGKSDAPESLQRARREEDSSPMSRGILFDEASPSPSPNARPPIRGGMTASLSSGSLQQQAKPPVSPSVVPLADYTSPNYQRFDNAPSSAPNNGPAPIYGFNAAPVGAKHALQSAIESPLVEPPRPPPRRSTMASCLKIDVGTSIDQARFRRQTARSERHRGAEPRDRGGATAATASAGFADDDDRFLAHDGGAHRVLAASPSAERRPLGPRAARLAFTLGWFRVSRISHPEPGRRGVRAPSERSTFVLVAELKPRHVDSRRRRRIPALARWRLQLRATHERRER